MNSFNFKSAWKTKGEFGEIAKSLEGKKEILFSIQYTHN